MSVIITGGLLILGSFLLLDYLLHKYFENGRRR